VVARGQHTAVNSESCLREQPGQSKFSINKFVSKVVWFVLTKCIYFQELNSCFELYYTMGLRFDSLASADNRQLIFELIFSTRTLERVFDELKSHVSLQTSSQFGYHLFWILCRRH